MYQHAAAPPPAPLPQARHWVPEDLPTPVQSSIEIPLSGQTRHRSCRLPLGPHLSSPPLPVGPPLSTVLVTPRSPLSLQNLLFRHQQPSGRPIPTQHRREGQPQLLLGAGEWMPSSRVCCGVGPSAGGRGAQHLEVVAAGTSAPRATTPQTSLEWSPRGRAAPSTSPTSCTCPRPPTASLSPGATTAR